MKTRFSKYLTMRDGIKIALEVYLPRHAEGPVPTILHQTRYFRAIQVARRAGWRLEPAFDMLRHTRNRFLKAGYAWMDVDVRGSGASSGKRLCPWSPDEVDDGIEVIDWVIAQPWSSGLVGATGISYAGTTAEMLLTRQHPALRAIAPRFSLFDVYTDVMSPGGVPLQWFTNSWNRVNQALDRAEYDRVVGIVSRLFVQSISAGALDPRTPRFARHLGRLDHARLESVVATLVRRLKVGIRPVSDEAALLDAAIREHFDNYDVHEQAQHIDFRDDIAEGTEAYDDLPSWRAIEGSVGRFSPHSYQSAIQGSGAAIYSFSGWLDGAYQFASIKRHLTTQSPGGRLIIGPWEHGGHLHVSPHATDRLSGFDHESELLGFFDHHLKGAPAPETAPVRYYTIGEERWKSATTWPPPGTHPARLHLGEGRSLSPNPPTGAHTESLSLPTHTTTGGATRWRSYVGPHFFIGYPDRARQGRGVPAWTSAPLGRDLEVTGHPTICLWLDAAVDDGDLFVYLEEVRGDSVFYVTEGMLRLSHRKLATGPASYTTPLPFWRTFRREDAAPLPHAEPVEVQLALLPVSYMFRRGSHIRILLTGADRDNFGAPRPLGTIRLHRSPDRPSHIDLPLGPGADLPL